MAKSNTARQKYIDEVGEGCGVPRRSSVNEGSYGVEDDVVAEEKSAVFKNCEGSSPRE